MPVSSLINQPPIALFDITCSFRANTCQCIQKDAAQTRTKAAFFAAFIGKLTQSNKPEIERIEVYRHWDMVVHPIKALLKDVASKIPCSCLPQHMFDSQSAVVRVIHQPGPTHTLHSSFIFIPDKEATEIQTHM